MATLPAVRDAIMVRLSVIANLRVHDTFPESVNPPAAIVMLPQNSEFADYRLTFSGEITQYDVEVLVVVQQGTLRSAQDALDALVSTTSTGSICGAIRADTTLGGTAHYTNVGAARDYGGKEIGAVEYFGAVVPLRVWTG